jgi:hypothetical protein
MSATARLELPLLSPGQAQKELFHNEALQAIDVLVAPAVEEPPRASPPSSPTIGNCYIIAGSASGAWAGKSDQIACFTSGGWRYAQPREGMSTYVRGVSLDAVYRGGSWEIGTVRASGVMIDGQQVVGPRVAAVDAPAGGSTVDAEARACIGQMLAALQDHGLIES